MANYKLALPLILNHEGGFVNHPKDKGGATNKGVTLKLFQKVFGKDKDVNDLKNITDDEVELIFTRVFWEPMRLSEVNNQSLANFIADFAYNSGQYNAIRTLQKELSVFADGIVGEYTLKAFNAIEEWNFSDLKFARKEFVRKIVERNPSQQVFLKGWENRINSFKYQE